MSCFKCTDCNFVAKSSQGLGVHRSKKHNVADSLSMNVVSVSVVREYPERRSFYCCLCDSIVVNFQHFTRYFKNLHPGIRVISSAHCSVCDKDFSSGQGAGVHVKRTKCGRSKIPVVDEPIISTATYRDDDSMTDTSDLQANVTLSPTEPPPSLPNTPLDPAVAFSGCTAEERLTLTHSPKDNNPADNTSTAALNDCNTDDTFMPTIPTRPIPPVTRMIYRLRMTTIPLTSPDPYPKTTISSLLHLTPQLLSSILPHPLPPVPIRILHLLSIILHHLSRPHPTSGPPQRIFHLHPPSPPQHQPLGPHH